MSESVKRKAEEVDAGAKKPRLPKRKVALQLGYCGTGYHGMQLNAPHKTIEGDLFEALVKAGAISEDNADDPKKSSFLRAARTDKGVHAAGNVVSLKMIIEDPDIVSKVNAHLPEQIRLWGFTRTNRAFECRKMCSSRVYEYVLPTYCLMNPSPLTKLGKAMQAAGKLDQGVLAEESRTFWKEVEDELLKKGVTLEMLNKAREEQLEEKAAEKTNEKDAEKEGKGQSEGSEEEIKTTPEDEAENALVKTLKEVENAARRKYRAVPERIEALRACLQKYQGVHNFHNFTVGKTFKDPSSTRVMHSLTVSEPFVISNTEWVSVKIHGQSFMLHQIRKMIALAVLIVRTNSDPAKIDALFAAPRVSIPKAPALGLLLERPVYDAYNLRLGKLGHESVTFEQYEEQIDAFKRKFIYDGIYTKEKEENEFHAFFGFMDTYRLDKLLDFLLDIKSEPEPESAEAVEAASDEEHASD